jgi:hypothetical protein
VKPILSLRACGARPSAKRPSDAKNALRGQSRCDARGVFLGGARSPRPQVPAGRKPGEVMITDGRAKGWWPRGENIWIGPMPSLPGVRSPPFHKMANRCDGRLRGKPGDGAEGGFLGGARSPRPDCKAELAPWHSISTRWGARGGWPTGDMSRTNPCHPPAVRSPPLQGGGRPEKTAYREGAGDGAKSEFCGGTRSARPEGSVPAHAGAWLLGHRVPCPGNWCQHFSRPGGGA